MIITPSPDHTGNQTIGNWLLHPKLPNVRRALRERITLGRNNDGPDNVLLSHAIDPEAARALGVGDARGFLDHRKAAIERVVADRIEALAAWDELDRPNLRRLIEATG